MIIESNNKDSHKLFSSEAQDAANEGTKQYYFAASAAAGDLDNDKVKFCYTCRNRGHPHEAITLEKVNGSRVLSDGTNEVTRWKLRNYFDGQEHHHKQPRKEAA